MNTMWLFGYNIVIAANQNIHEIHKKYTGIDSVTAPFIGELRVLRAYGYYHLIDLFGNVPIVTQYDSTHTAVGNDPVFETGRKKLFDTIINDINKGMPYLSAEFDNTTFGAFNKWAAYALLAKMYINAEVWTGTARWDECIAACDSIIKSGKFVIASDYFSNFIQKNQDSKENILVVPYNQSSSELMEGMYFMSLHYNSDKKYNTIGAPWNGFCALPDHYHSFASNDVRRKGWEVGPQFSSTGVALKCSSSRKFPSKNLTFTADFTNPYDTTDTHPYSYKDALEVNGGRLVKYEIAKGLPKTCLGVPLALFRYADILMLKAEAEMMKNGGVATSDAVSLVNQIRTRASQAPYTIDQLTLDELLAERGREFYYEGIRRQDLVRFGKFVRGTWGRNFSGPYQDQWYDRSTEGDYRNVFPIPSQQMGGAGMNQNPGY